MKLSIVFRRQARMEFDAAADWYNKERTGLGTVFTAAVQRVLDDISENPLRFPEVHDDVREGLVVRFPYCVYYRSEPAHILILSIFHTSRDPAIWQARV